ncbi:MAG: hypothetical protein KDA37_06410, partial [Planctomycetales bacterium]|nr:hypothetical protein [Planctomycetales bacterium]
MERLVSLLGLAVMIGLAWLMSTHKTRFPLRVVTGGLLLQFLFGWFVMRTEIGERTFQLIDTAFTAVVHCSDAGSGMLFGELITQAPLAFQVLPTIVFFSALMSLLYYLGVMQAVVSAAAWLMQKTLGTSGAETLSAAANIFVGQTEAPLVIRPYIPSMTTSELNAVMVGGFATIAGGVLAAYVGMLEGYQEIGVGAKDLLAASVISAPAALLIAKVMRPETETPKTLGHVSVEVHDDSVNALDAVAAGATSGLKLALNVGAMLIVFFSL